MTTTQPPRDHGRSALGRGVSTLIPQSAALSPADRAAAALATIRTVPVHVGVLEAAVLLLKELGRTTEDETTRSIADTTAALLRAAAEQQPAEGTSPSASGRR
ncbi:hypothetical protein [Streptomyces yaizuensis]|uniref:ANTAR domain-containing protein n=1 Tax=Streptomyces yaizuensis TaxID=2989713 RepID=A0ABQ5NY73_9ACTN|nr:hypothetical protein [Streptomyces sp. YSPA8]GLF95135.1 hypothetical protein SYYSPA8_12580 [Streptomyces sp. YSPA8]